jgi:hypothetical protein
VLNIQFAQLQVSSIRGKEVLDDRKYRVFVSTTVTLIFGIDITKVNWNCIDNISNLKKSSFFFIKIGIVLQKVPTKMWKSNKNRKAIQKSYQWVDGQRGHKMVVSGSQGIPIRRQKKQKNISVIFPQTPQIRFLTLSFTQKYPPTFVN